MNVSQCLDDWPAGRQGSDPHRQGGGGLVVAWGELYSESHRLALEELVAGGEEAYSSFLQRERLKPFLSSVEISQILRSTLSPEPGLEQSLDLSVDCSTGTYFPDASDIEVPELDLGWPTYPNNWYRGVTRVEVHFQPSFGEVVYACKEAIRALIRKAEKVIALVMDSFTDIEIFKDVHEACSRRQIPVYIILDQSGLPEFLQMCRNACVCLDVERKLRVRTITGSTYYTRTGARIVGKANEKFMLIDGDKVATGSYSFTWTEGKLNRSNLTVLSGQVSEFYDEEFRVLYAQSKPITPKLSSPSKRGDRQEMAAGQAKEILAVAKPSEPGEVTRSPGQRKPGDGELRIEGLPISKRAPRGQGGAFGGEEPEETKKDNKSVCTQTDEEAVPATSSGAATQTCVEVSQQGTQTSSPLRPAALPANPAAATAAAAAQTETASAGGRPATVEKRGAPAGVDEPALSTGRTLDSHSSSSNSSGNRSTGVSGHTSSGSGYPGGRPPGEQRPTGFLGGKSNLRHGFLNLTKDRRYHYSNLRSKLDDMVSILARRPGREPARYPLRNSKDLVNRNGVLRLRDMPSLASMALRN